MSRWCWIAGWDRITIVVYDAASLALTDLENGHIDAMVVQNPYQMGYLGTRLMKALIEDDRRTIAEMYAGYDPQTGQFNGPDADIFTTEMRVVVPDDHSPLRPEMFSPETEFFRYSDFRAWLRAKSDGFVMSDAAGRATIGFARQYRNEIGLIVAVLLVVGFTLVYNQDYLQQPRRNLQDILHQTGLLGIFWLGAAVVIIAGGIDLSSGSVIVFCGSICGLTMLILAPTGENGLPDASDVGVGVVGLAIAVTLLMGLMVGTLHTWLINVIHLPPFVATLASLVGLRSLAKILNQAVTAQLGNQVTKVRADDVTFAVWVSGGWRWSCSWCWDFLAGC